MKERPRNGSRHADRVDSGRRRATLAGVGSPPQLNFPLVQMLEPRRLFSSFSVIDLMVLYTPQALSDAGSIAALDKRLERSIADTNLAMGNSLVSAGLRLVHEQEVNYTESGVLNTDLSNLQQGRGVFNNLEALRDQYGADLVSLWVGSGSGNEAGLAFQPDNFSTPQPDYGYSVIEEPYADDNYVFAHEIAHNLGAGHDRSDPTPRRIPYAYGQTFQLGNYTVGDIMSDVDRIPYYSNPSVTFDGIPTGSPDNSSQPADNARVMNEFAPIVANFRPSVVPDTTAPAAALEGIGIDPSRQTLTVKIAYEDDTAVSVASLGPGALLVAGPAGFSQLATLQGVDQPTDGPQRLATYETSIAGSSTDPNAYAFYLEPNRVSDIYGHFNAGGWLGPPFSVWANRAGPRLATASDAGTIDGTTWRFVNRIDADDPTAFYRFTLTEPAQFTANLSQMRDSLDELLVQDRNSDGQIQPQEILSYPHRIGTTPETISLTLAPGSYYLWVAPATLGANSPYNLTMSAVALAAPGGGSIAGTVFNDANADAIREPIEGGLAGWEVYADLNNDGRLDPGEPTAWTDAQGNYRLADLPAGHYIIRALPQPGWRQTLPFNDFGHHITVGPNQLVSGADFGQTTQALITGFVFNDANGNGTWDAGERGLGGWRVFLDENNDGVWQWWEPSAVTDQWGNWSFDDLTPGSYTLRVIPQLGWRATFPTGGVLHVTVASGQVLNLQLFGEQPI